MSETVTDTVNPIVGDPVEDARDGGSSVAASTVAPGQAQGHTEKRHHQVDSLSDESFSTQCGRLLILFVVQAFIMVTFALVYTELGYGATVFKTLAKHHSLYSYTFPASLGIVFCLYIFDFRFWAPGPATAGVGALCALAFLLSAVFVFKAKPYSPVAVIYVGAPALYAFFNKVVFKSTPLYNYMMTLAAVLLMSGAVALSVTLLWASSGQTGFADGRGTGFWWGSESKLEFRARLRVCRMTNCTLYLAEEAAGVDTYSDGALACPEVNTTRCEYYGQTGLKCECAPEDEIEVESACAVWDEDDPALYNDHCLAAFMLWACPFIGSLLSIVFGVICVLLASTVRETQLHHTAMSPAIKIFGYIMMFGVLGVWTAASIAGASMEAADLVTTFAFLTVVICVVAIGSTIGWRAMEQQLETIPVVAKLQQAGSSDYLKAICLLTIGPPSLIYFLVSFFNQTFRRTLPCTKNVENEEKTLLVTQVGHHQIDVIKHWNWTSVLSKAIGVGFFYFIFAVGVGKFTNVGLSALNTYLEPKSLGFVSSVYFVVGFCMFLLPPVPGIPVYLTGGIVVAKSAAVEFGDGDNENFTAGIVYATLIACLVKAIAILGQQKVIGGKLGNLVSVRKTVGVNSITIRAIKKILQQKGLPLNKVAILVGGPDWPTSVLTGILKCDYLQMLLGSAPFLITIGVTVLSGALLLKAEESPQMGAAASSMLFIASLVQSGCLMAALVAIQDVATKYKDELEAEPPDTEVLKAEELAHHYEIAYLKCTHWTVIPKWVRALLITELSMMYISLAIFVGMSSSSFEQVSIQTKIEEAPLHGDIFALVKPTGRIGFGFHLCAVLLHQFVFTQWAKSEVKATISGQAIAAQKALQEDSQLADSKMAAVKQAAPDEVPRQATVTI